MTNVMLDIETLGTAPGSVIISVGAVEFTRDGLGREFYAVIDRQTCLAAGLTEDTETVLWWAKQSAEAREAYEGAHAIGAKQALGSVLHDFAAYLRAVSPSFLIKGRVWGNGSAFDNALVAEAYRRCGLRLPWQHRGDRCYRTLKALRPNITAVRQGTEHNALDDARMQAEHAARILNDLPVEW